MPWKCVNMCVCVCVCVPVCVCVCMCELCILLIKSHRLLIWTVKENACESIKRVSLIITNNCFIEQI